MRTYSEYINEGFFSWIKNLIKSLFTDDTSDETKEYTNNSLQKIKKINSELIKPTEKIISKNNALEFINEITKYKNELLRKNVISEEEGIKWELLMLSIKIRIANDNNDKKLYKNLKTSFNNLIKKPEVKKIAQELTKEIK